MVGEYGADIDRLNNLNNLQASPDQAGHERSP